MIDMGPGKFGGTAARHDADVATGNSQQFLVPTAHLRHDRFRLTGRSNVVTLCNHGQQIGTNIADLDPRVSYHKLSTHELVVAVQVHNQLTKCTTQGD